MIDFCERCGNKIESLLDSCDREEGKISMIFGDTQAEGGFDGDYKVFFEMVLCKNCVKIIVSRIKEHLIANRTPNKFDVSKEPERYAAWVGTASGDGLTIAIEKIDILYICKGVMDRPECIGCHASKPHSHKLCSYQGCKIGGKCEPVAG